MPSAAHPLYHPNAPARVTVISNTRITSESCDEVRHLVLDRSGHDLHHVEGQSIGILTPGPDASAGAIHLRYYSIASPSSGDDGAGKTLSICVKRVVERDPATGAITRGWASNYLCDLRPGDSVAVTSPSGGRLKLPDDPASNVILVATGTGISPFRAFLWHMFREHPKWQGQVYLFFGNKRGGEFLYREELESFAREPNFHLVLAHSREQATSGGERMYVHHRVSEQLDSVWELLGQERTYLYVCGLRGTDTRVFDVLAARAQADGVSWEDRETHLRATGRLQIETY